MFTWGRTGLFHESGVDPWCLSGSNMTYIEVFVGNSSPESSIALLYHALVAVEMRKYHIIQQKVFSIDDKLQQQWLNVLIVSNSKKPEYHLHITVPVIKLVCIVFPHTTDSLKDTATLRMYDGPGPRAPHLRKVVLNRKAASYINLDAEHNLQPADKWACFNSFQAYVITGKYLTMVYQSLNLKMASRVPANRDIVLPFTKTDVREIDMHKSGVCDYGGETNVACFFITWHSKLHNAFYLAVDSEFHGPNSLLGSSTCQYGGIYTYRIKSPTYEKVTHICSSTHRYIYYLPKYDKHLQENPAAFDHVMMVFYSYAGYSSGTMSVSLGQNVGFKLATLW